MERVWSKIFLELSIFTHKGIKNKYRKTSCVQIAINEDTCLEWGDKHEFRAQTDVVSKVPEVSSKIFHIYTFQF